MLMKTLAFKIEKIGPGAGRSWIWCGKRKAFISDLLHDLPKKPWGGTCHDSWKLRIQYCLSSLVSKVLEAKINHNSSYKQTFTLKPANRGKPRSLNKADTKMREGGKSCNVTFKPLQQQVQLNTTQDAKDKKGAVQTLMWQFTKNTFLDETSIAPTPQWGTALVFPT